MHLHPVLGSGADEVQQGLHGAAKLARFAGDAAVAGTAIAAPAVIPFWIANANAWILAAMPALGVLYLGYRILGMRAYWRYWDARRRRGADQ